MVLLWKLNTNPMATENWSSREPTSRICRWRITMVNNSIHIPNVKQPVKLVILKRGSSINFHIKMSKFISFKLVCVN
jgi:hypothetical protein